MLIFTVFFLSCVIGALWFICSGQPGLKSAHADYAVKAQLLFIRLCVVIVTLTMITYVLNCVILQIAKFDYTDTPFAVFSTASLLPSVISSLIVLINRYKEIGIGWLMLMFLVNLFCAAGVLYIVL